jgi:hypothetical protein
MCIIIVLIIIIIIIIMIIVIRNHFGWNLYRQQTTGRLPWANGFHVPPYNSSKMAISHASDQELSMIPFHGVDQVIHHGHHRLSRSMSHHHAYTIAAVRFNLFAQLLV